MTELESRLLMAQAVIDIIKTCEPKQKEFWIEMRRMLLYASAEEFNKYCMKISKEDDFIEKMAEDHIITQTKEGDVVLDPFCGSGTTLKMAKINHRRYIGFDISQEYCDITNLRLSKV